MPQVMNPARRQVLRARRLRRDASNAERRFWGQVRRGVYGVRIRRQHPIGPIIVDFAIPSRRIAIEIDGEGHDAEIDMARNRLLRTRGWRVIRIAVQELDRDIGDVIDALARAIEDPTLLD